MKHLIAICLALCLAAPVYTTKADDDLNKELNKELAKQLKKAYKNKKKEFEKDKWKIYGTTKTLEVALLEHYTKLYDPNNDAYEIVGIADNFKSRNIGRQQAVNNANISYAQQAGSKLKGRIVSDLGANADDVSAEFDHFYAAYERLLEKEIKNELQESFCIIREDKDNGTYDMQIFFIISENAATKARIRAYENALRESQAAQQYADKISEFVKEGFSPENPE